MINRIIFDLFFKCTHLYKFNKTKKVFSRIAGEFSTGALGALVPAILKNGLLAPAIFEHFSTVGKKLQVIKDVGSPAARLRFCTSYVSAAWVKRWSEAMGFLQT